VLEVKAGPETSQPWLQQDRITVWGFDDDHAEYAQHNPTDKWCKPKPLHHKSTLLFHSRCLVISETLVPEEYLRQMNNVLKAKGL
jgi:hypothetical protein